MIETDLLRQEQVDGVRIVTIDNPPVNALAPGVREGIIDAVQSAADDPEVEAIIIIGAGRNFIAGADIRQFGKARNLSTRVSAGVIENLEKPVIAAIDGYALGGGLEHALACHYRIATPAAKLGLPEVMLGIIPAGGGTTRLTRLVGPEAALDLVLSARHVPADEALRMGLVDEIVEAGDLREAAIRYAKSVAASRPLRRLGADGGARSTKDAGEVFARARKQLQQVSRFQKAPGYAVDCIEAAMTRPLAECLELEQKYIEELEGSDVSKALRYAFFAERKAAKIPGAPSGAPEPVRAAAVVGAGTMGSGIAIAFANAGVPVKILENSAEALDRGMKRISDDYAGRVKRGRVSRGEADERLALIEPVLDYAAIGDCDAVVEAVFERIDLKQDVFKRLDEVMKVGALLLTNSSAIDINTMADATQRPGDVAGAHFFAPAHVMKLCEIVRGDRSSISTITRAAQMARDLGKVGVVSGTCDGFAANRSRAPLVTEAMLMLEEGALPAQIDRVMVDFGYPMGPFAVSDLSGLDVSYDTRKRRAAQNPDFRKLHVPDRMVEMGRFGQKTGAGWYRYEEGSRKPLPDDTVKEVIAGVAKDFGISQREFTDDEILRRLLLASVNEGCKILEEGKAYRASDLDVMWLNGFGFPRHRGGVMYWADSIGAAEIHRQISEWFERYGKRWAPARLLADLAESGGQLRDLKAAT